MKIGYISGLFLILITYSCDRQRVYEKIYEIPPHGWNQNHILKYSFPVVDTARAYDIYLHVRNRSNYKYNNLWLFIETTSPNGNTLPDTFEIRLVDDAGRWKGKGIGDVNYLLVPYMQNVLLPFRGVYKVTIQHGMRDNTLTDLFDVGLRLQYHK